ncbi:LysR family transcriptional regulator [Brucella anthropi]|uniref:LysR family transcriptional regulator n=1 Tax=Brucella anthropi TaxID=529 RepID=UPI003986E488
MNRASPDWSLYRSFVAVLREGSLTGAARVLGISQPTLGRHIAALEASLGVSLFTRSPEGLRPLPAAEMLRPKAEALAAAADALYRSASGQKASHEGTVRIAASEVIAAEVLPAEIARLQATYPQITVELAVSNRFEDLLRRDADIAIRMARPSQDGLVARKIASIELGLFAHPRYLARCPAPVEPGDISQHRLIGFDTALPYTRLLALEGQPLLRERFALRTDSDMAQMAAIRAGCGIGVCHAPLAEGLVRILPDYFAPTIEMWMVMHMDLRQAAPYRIAFDNLCSGLKAFYRHGATERQ